MRRIGLFGGSFNPPHQGHVHIAEYAYKALGLHEVRMMVTPRNPHKDPAQYAPLCHRLAMSHIISAPHDWLQPIDVERYFSTTDTADTLTLLSALHPQDEYVWIMGADNFSGFDKWVREAHRVKGDFVPDWRYVMHNFSIAVMPRPGDGDHVLQSAAAQWGQSYRLHDPLLLGRRTPGWALLDNPPRDVSSTQILTDLRAGKPDVPGLPQDVLSYIHSHNLYTGPMEQGLTAAAPHFVPLQAMLAFAAIGNFLKSVSTVVPDDVFEYYRISFQKSLDKGDWNKAEDVPGEIADCLISLHWLARLQGVDIPEYFGAQETQSSVSEWCDMHYPGEGLQKRTLNLVEELAELMACQGLELERGFGLLQVIFDDPLVGELEESYFNAFQALSEYSMSIGSTPYALLDQKMAQNRSRSQADSSHRLATKEHIIQKLRA